MTDRTQAPRSDTDYRLLVDRLVLEHGRLEPLELLLAADLLAYEDYEAWRLGQRPDLQGALQRDPNEIADLLRLAGEYARSQRLEPTPIEYRGWGRSDRPIRIGHDSGLAAACACAYAPPAGRVQLDLFHDSSTAIAEEELRRALTDRRLDTARHQLARLIQRDPRHARLNGFLRLMEAIDGDDGRDSGARTEDRLGDLEELERLAPQLLGHRARDFLTPLWAALAEQLSGRAFDPDCPQLHPSYAYGRAQRWDAARAAVEAEPNWRDHPALVLAHAEACWRRRLAAAARRDWMWLCWEHPSDAERALSAPAFPDQCLSDCWNRFGDLAEGTATEDFPAWMLLADPGHATAVPPDAAPADERGTAYRLLHALVTGADTIKQRRELAEIHPRLLELFLSRREQI